MPFLICRHLSKRTDWNVTVELDHFTLGFSESATIPLPDPTLAPKEVEVRREGERFVIRHLVDRSGLFLNGSATRESLLEDGDWLQLGKVLIVFFEHAPGSLKQVDLRLSGMSREVLERAVALPPPESEDDAYEGASFGGLSRGFRAVVLLGAVLLGVFLGFFGPRLFDSWRGESSVRREEGKKETQEAETPGSRGASSAQEKGKSAQDP
jgi:pSer/pThr/pTyr-binding forkhead associated (FHA) protein